MEEKNITLSLPNNQKKIVKYELANKLTLISQMLEDMDEITIDDEIPLIDSSCDIQTVTIVFDFLEWASDKTETYIKENSVDFLSSSCNLQGVDPSLFNLIKCVNYLDRKDLLDASCRLVANEIKKCKDPEEIRQRFNILNDFTPEEEQSIQQDMAWSGSNEIPPSEN